MATDPIVLSFHENLLRVSDILLLEGPHWLNDQIISFYFEFLEKTNYKDNFDILFISPEVTQCIKISPEFDLHLFLSPLKAEKKKFIFFALNDNSTCLAGGSHWSLLVFSRPENIFLHFDSSNNLNYVQCQKFVKKLKNILNCKNATCKSMKSLQQINAYDCGIHVLAMTDHLANHINIFESIEDVEMLQPNAVCHKREQILKIISSLAVFTRSITSSVFRTYKDQHWRSLYLNPNSFGPLTNLPDYTYMDGRPTPLALNLKKRLEKHKEIAQKIVIYNDELKFAKFQFNEIQKQNNKVLLEKKGNQLKEKGYLWNKK